jgi:glycosyltransferase involved in cell wall biosynthesis
MQVIRNVPTTKKVDSPFNERKNILIYQGVLNMERGIEIMIQAMQYLPDYQLIIAGKGVIENDLKKLCNELHLNDKIIFTGNIDIFSLHYYTQQAKIGFSLEQGRSINYFYALPNKIFDYIQAETPVICANLQEMRKLVEKYSVGDVFEGNNPKELADFVVKFIAQKAEFYSQNCGVAKQILNWENEEKKLLKIYNVER